MDNEIKCTICDAPMVGKYSKTILHKYTETLYECGNKACGHLRFANVHWLNEAYSNAIASLDTGAVRRCLNIRKTLYLLLFSLYGLGIKNIKMIDYGGGAGLLSRLLRDVGVDCYSHDKYAENIYCRAFAAKEENYQALSMIEVIEHLEHPAEELKSIINTFTPEILLISTQLFDEHTPENWWYFTPSTGQHISFFTKKSMALLAEKFGYKVAFRKNVIIWVKKERAIPALFALTALPFLRECVFAIATIVTRKSPQKDFEWIERNAL